jgi:hypothetical protein
MQWENELIPALFTKAGGLSVSNPAAARLHFTFCIKS